MLPCKIRPFVIFDNRNKLFSIARFARYWRLSFKPKTGTETHEPSLCLLYSMCFCIFLFSYIYHWSTSNMIYKRPVEKWVVDSSICPPRRVIWVLVLLILQTNPHSSTYYERYGCSKHHPSSPPSSLIHLITVSVDEPSTHWPSPIP